MSRLSLAFVRVAVVLLPVTVQPRFLDEWRAEAEIVRQQSVNWLLLASPFGSYSRRHA